MPTSVHKGVIFDLDGTLIDSFQDIVDSWNEALGKHGLPALPAVAYTTAVRQGKQAVLRLVIPKENIGTALVEAVLNTYLITYRQRWDRRTAVFPEVEDMLYELKNRGVRFAVLSNKSQEMTVRCCRRFLSAAEFSIICGSMDETKNKPAPDQALAICRHFSLPPSRVALIGDSSVDLETAHNAGISPFLALWGGVNFDESVPPYPFGKLGTPVDVLRIF